MVSCLLEIVKQQYIIKQHAKILFPERLASKVKNVHLE